jgi:transcriptional regulator with XRE-family HTH domain
VVPPDGRAAEMSDPIDVEVARIRRRIRSWREEKGFTLQDLAERSELATSTVQKIETGQMIPSVAVLLKLARGLGRRATELIHDGGYDATVLHSRARDRHVIRVRRKMAVERMSADLASPALEMWRLTLQPGTSSGSEPISYEGEELVVCEEGVVTFAVGDRDFALEPGDSLHFKASIPHSWRNDGKAPTRFTLTGTLPEIFRGLMQQRVAAGGGDSKAR